MKAKYLLMLLMTSMLFVGCNAQKNDIQIDDSSKTEVTNEQTYTVAQMPNIEFRSAEVVKGSDIVIATVAYQDGKPVNIVFDELIEGKKSKYSEAMLGNYAMGPGSTPWYEQVESLAQMIVENNFDTSKIGLNESGKVDAVSGVSIYLGDLVKAADRVLQPEKEAKEAAAKEAAVNEAAAKEEKAAVKEK